MATPVYRQVARDWSSSTPSRRSSSSTSTAVAGADGSISWWVPKPGLEAWWSNTTRTGAAKALSCSRPSLLCAATSKQSTSSGTSGTSAAGTISSWPGRKVSDSGTTCGSSPKETRTCLPSARSARAAAREEPSASPSGQMWQIRSIERARPISATTCCQTSSKPLSSVRGPGSAARAPSTVLVEGAPVVDPAREAACADSPAMTTRPRRHARTPAPGTGPRRRRRSRPRRWCAPPRRWPSPGRAGRRCSGRSPAGRPRRRSASG